MTHVTPGGSGVAGLPAISHAHPSHRLDGRGLRAGIAERRRKLFDLELAMVAQCEAQAARGHAPEVRIHDRETWDRAPGPAISLPRPRWNTSAGPSMRRLLREIGQLERLLALPDLASEAAA